MREGPEAADEPRVPCAGVVRVSGLPGVRVTGCGGPSPASLPLKIARVGNNLASQPAGMIPSSFCPLFVTEKKSKTFMNGHQGLWSACDNCGSGRTSAKSKEA